MFADKLRKEIEDKEEQAKLDVIATRAKQEEISRKYKEECLAKFPDFLEAVLNQCKENNVGVLVIDSEQEWLKKTPFYGAHYILEDKFEEIRNFGISNGFKVIADKWVEIGRNCSYNHTVDGNYDIEDNGPIDGPRITFNW